MGVNGIRIVNGHLYGIRSLLRVKFRERRVVPGMAFPSSTDPYSPLPTTLEVSDPTDTAVRQVLDASRWTETSSIHPMQGFILLPARASADAPLREDAAVRIEGAISRMGQGMGRSFGNQRAPLLLTLLRHRNMDGVGETIRVDHVGLGECTLPGLLDRVEDPRWVYAAYAQLILQFARILPERRERGVGRGERSLWPLLNRRLHEFLSGRGYRHTGQCTAEDWAYLSGTFKAMLRFAAGTPFPEDPWAQMWTFLAHWTAEDRYADPCQGPCVRFIRVGAVTA